MMGLIIISVVVVFILFVVAGIFLWWFEGVDEACENIADIKNQLEKMNYNIDLFAKKFDVVDKNQEDRNS